MLLKVSRRTQPASIACDVALSSPFSNSDTSSGLPISPALPPSRLSRAHQGFHRNEIESDPALWKTHVIREVVLDMVNKEVVCYLVDHQTVLRQYMHPSCFFLLKKALRALSNPALYYLDADQPPGSPPPELHLPAPSAKAKRSVFQEINSEILETTSSVLPFLVHLQKPQPRPPKTPLEIRNEVFAKVRSDLFDIYRRFVLHPFLKRQLPASYQLWLASSNVVKFERRIAEIDRSLDEYAKIAIQIKTTLCRMRTAFVDHVLQISPDSIFTLETIPPTPLATPTLIAQRADDVPSALEPAPNVLDSLPPPAIVVSEDSLDVHPPASVPESLAQAADLLESNGAVAAAPPAPDGDDVATPPAARAKPAKKRLKNRQCLRVMTNLASQGQWVMTGSPIDVEADLSNAPSEDLNLAAIDKLVSRFSDSIRVEFEDLEELSDAFLKGVYQDLQTDVAHINNTLLSIQNKIDMVSRAPLDRGASGILPASDGAAAASIALAPRDIIHAVASTRTFKLHESSPEGITIEQGRQYLEELSMALLMICYTRDLVQDELKSREDRPKRPLSRPSLGNITLGNPNSLIAPVSLATASGLASFFSSIFTGDESHPPSPTSRFSLLRAPSPSVPADASDSQPLTTDRPRRKYRFTAAGEIEILGTQNFISCYEVVCDLLSRIREMRNAATTRKIEALQGREVWKQEAKALVSETEERQRRQRELLEEKRNRIAEMARQQSQAMMRPPQRRLMSLLQQSPIPGDGSSSPGSQRASGLTESDQIAVTMGSPPLPLGSPLINPVTTPPPPPLEGFLSEIERKLTKPMTQTSGAEVPPRADSIGAVASLSSEGDLSTVSPDSKPGLPPSLVDVPVKEDVLSAVANEAEAGLASPSLPDFYVPSPTQRNLDTEIELSLAEMDLAESQAVAPAAETTASPASELDLVLGHIVSTKLNAPLPTGMVGV
ncbi:uncharacterized protein BJ171DRAFT_7645 [Polychytrium aggregatum]|uniref:uncharacterized protein n=1 Tax=Polychytrium aggregatum TaxID=110093 RepID=UPI0022FED326|nr:uncharacterized protein BJ171DRAFT_7645 [Polychytrium aggregatum]KAI9209798.1 hypothetical protein BJ171DRAFT_7645 [Polychytrium aggregatum]